MDICRTVYDTVIFGQLLAPKLMVFVKGPIIAIESAPQNRLSALVQKLLGNNTEIIGFNNLSLYERPCSYSR